mmetsp:Transcript_27499/g.83677  ORF Transcript_27499/g.83677 Transcript_27499/m.83677 type:complete len:228 (-) Transcript_27499:2590-3273(-)
MLASISATILSLRVSLPSRSWRSAFNCSWRARISSSFWLAFSKVLFARAANSPKPFCLYSRSRPTNSPSLLASVCASTTRSSASPTSIFSFSCALSISERRSLSRSRRGTSFRSISPRSRAIAVCCWTSSSSCSCTLSLILASASSLAISPSFIVFRRAVSSRSASFKRACFSSASQLRSARSTSPARSSISDLILSRLRTTPCTAAEEVSAEIALSRSSSTFIFSS